MLIVIAGPTASGKTALGIELSKRLDAEIVSADSQQVYRFFNIGTAKPTPDQTRLVPHHLIDVVDPSEPFSAARYQELADEAISDIQRRGKRAIVLGGTGLYVRVLLHGLMPAPPRDAKLRDQLVLEANEKGNDVLHRRLREIDPQAAAAIQVDDQVRIIRALEIYHLTGKPASVHRSEHAFSQVRYDYRLFVLNPPRTELFAAIDQRVRRLFDQGILDEVRELVRRGFGQAPAMGSVGYAEALAAVEGRLTVNEAMKKASQATRRYAKRQLTWFRKEPKAEFILPTLEAITESLGTEAVGPTA